MSRSRITNGYFTGSMVIPSRAGKIDLGLIARGLLTGIQARRLDATTFEITSSLPLLRGPYTVRVTGYQATCSCAAGSYGAICTHAALGRLLAATLREDVTP